MKTISAKRLEAAGACAGQVQLYRNTFGDKPVRLTPENWDKAGEVGLTRFWLERFLKKAAQAEYNRACGAAAVSILEGSIPVSSIQAEYNRACGAALLEALTK